MDTQYIRNILIVNNKQYGKSELIERLIEFCNRSMGYGEGICIPDMPGSHIVARFVQRFVIVQRILLIGGSRYSCITNIEMARFMS